MIVWSAFIIMASFPLSPTIKLLHPTKKEKFSSTFTKQQMASSGTTRPRGIVQQLTVPGMVSPVTTTHTLKLSCWLTTTWMVLFLQICGRSGTWWHCALLVIQDWGDALVTFCLEIWTNYSPWCSTQPLSLEIFLKISPSWVIYRISWVVPCTVMGSQVVCQTT